MLLFLNVIYVLIAISMVALILMQRGAGAQAGSGFGGGASTTVFGSRGSSNFLSKATKYLAILFFGITLFMAWQSMERAGGEGLDQDLGVMSPLPSAPVVPADPNASVPAAPMQAPAPAANVDSQVPAAPVDAPPATEPAPASGD
ncbi:MAG: preprotein translocase subunit SecG [Pseudomonadota bacterium]|nr:preprotein translocase subunit SecG [Pseudomonadota bacterium]